MASMSGQDHRDNGTATKIHHVDNHQSLSMEDQSNNSPPNKNTYSFTSNTPSTEPASKTDEADIETPATCVVDTPTRSSESSSDQQLLESLHKDRFLVVAAGLADLLDRYPSGDSIEPGPPSIGRRSREVFVRPASSGHEQPSSRYGGED